ncbi:hypothetical protein RHGRI_007994 [Rhododendron griersonianum]|uniref:Uncharacterized protein n=2 Tax=Rhododendron griersonianum TaxID=479676 RepID=A0AAV6L074_9ERIC|nr:hypothetical protein RHGRI_007994 [Rhododendron griersonianum]
MDTKEAIFMTRGDGENSYAQLSCLTQKVNAVTKPLLENAVRSLFSSKGFHVHGVLNIADLGCAAGPNAFSIISTVKETVEMKSRELNYQTPELQFYLNDLPGNDFNTLFRGLTYENSCFLAGVPGSFHGRLFPRKSLHLVHSSYSVHWLSQVPKGLTSREGLALNKGNIYISKTSSPLVREAYLTQFEEDFTMFLRSRSEEVVPNGCAVLILHGRQSPDPSSKECCTTWGLIAGAIAALISEGLIEEEKLDSFNVPYYTPSAKEVQDVVEREG